MPTSFDLIVVMIADDGLRSALAAQLTVMGENVISYSRSLTDVELDALASQHAVLIADQTMLGESLNAVLAHSGWRHVIILNGASADVYSDRLVRLSHDGAINEVSRALSEWRATASKK